MNEEVLRLSIPLWSDFIEPHFDIRDSDSELSIPLWSDFIDVPRPDGVAFIVSFQSHYGLILSDREGRIIGVRRLQRWVKR